MYLKKEKEKKIKKKKKKKKKKKLTEPGFEQLQNMSEKSTIFKQQLLKKNHMNFFKFSPENLLIVLYNLINVSILYL